MDKPFFEKAIVLWNVIEDFKHSETYERYERLKTELPNCAEHLHDDDVERILNCLVVEWRGIFSQYNSPAARKSVAEKMSRVRLLAASLLEELNSSDVAIFQDLLTEKWELANFLFANYSQGVVNLIGKDIYETDEDFSALKRQILSLVQAADFALNEDEFRSAPHAPKDNRRLEVSECLANAWVTIHLLAGCSLEDSLPSGRNGGLRWCFDMFQELNDAHCESIQFGRTSQHSTKRPTDLDQRVAKLYSDFMRDTDEDPSQNHSVVSANEFKDVSSAPKDWKASSFYKAINNYFKEVKNGEREDFPNETRSWSCLFFDSELAFEFIVRGADLRCTACVQRGEFPTHVLEDLGERRGK